MLLATSCSVAMALSKNKQVIHRHRDLNALALILSLLSCLLRGTHATFVVSRGIDDVSIAVNNSCDFENDKVITFSLPQSIESDDLLYGMGILSLGAVSMTLDHINTKRCGVKIRGENYSVVVKAYSDNSDPVKIAAIGHQIANQTDFLLSGYSTDMVAALTPIAEEYKTLLVAGGSSKTDLYVNNSYAFGTLPKSSTLLEQAFSGLSERGAKTVAYLVEDGSPLCAAVPDNALQYGMELVGEVTIPKNANDSEYDNAAATMLDVNPDVMITCVFGCAAWIKSMRSIGWSPKAQVFTMCAGSPALEEPAGRDVAYMMGAASWDRLLQSKPDAVTGWTPGEFADKFEATYFKSAAYQHTAAAAAISVTLQAIERADSTDTELVIQQLQAGTFNTMFGEIKFDENGQNADTMSLLMQYDRNGTLHVVYPEEKRTKGATDLVYPMPTWSHRDCMTGMKCEESGGQCATDGTCDCEMVTSTISIRNGTSAFCKIVPEENMNYISDTWMIVGIVLVAMQFVMSFGSMIWTYINRNKPIVKASQPFFLHMLSSGCLILASSIIPLFIQGAYRYVQNPLTGGLTDIPNPEIHKLDAACMAFPWLCGLGFAIIFSALFAKIWRVKKLMNHAVRFSRKVVEVKDVMSIMVVMIGIQTLILLLWQIIDPLRWQRDVLSLDAEGFPLESVGHCSSERSLAFIIPLALINGGSLIYALYLSWITRDVPSDFSEGKWITLTVMSMLQILLLAVPVVIIASENTVATFFVRSGVVYIWSSTVSVLIFGPKIWKLYHPDAEKSLEVRKSKFNYPSQHSVRWIGSEQDFRNSPLDALGLRSEFSDGTNPKVQNGTTSNFDTENASSEPGFSGISIPKDSNDCSVMVIDMVEEGNKNLSPQSFSNIKGDESNVSALPRKEPTESPTEQHRTNNQSSSTTNVSPQPYTSFVGDALDGFAPSQC